MSALSPSHHRFRPDLRRPAETSEISRPASVHTSSGRWERRTLRRLVGAKGAPATNETPWPMAQHRRVRASFCFSRGKEIDFGLSLFPYCHFVFITFALPPFQLADLPFHIATGLYNLIHPHARCERSILLCDAIPAS
jgi:hypothetical protein